MVGDQNFVHVQIVRYTQILKLSISFEKSFLIVLCSDTNCAQVYWSVQVVKNNPVSYVVIFLQWVLILKTSLYECKNVRIEFYDRIFFFFRIYIVIKELNF